MVKKMKNDMHHAKSSKHIFFTFFQLVSTGFKPNLSPQKLIFLYKKWLAVLCILIDYHKYKILHCNRLNTHFVLDYMQNSKTFYPEK